MFGRARIRELESQLQQVGIRADEQAQALRDEVASRDAALVQLRQSIAGLLRVVDKNDTVAREAISALVPDDVDQDALPQVEIFVTFVDVHGDNISGDVAMVAQALAPSMAAFLCTPSVNKISGGTELYKQFVPGVFMGEWKTYSRRTTEMAISSTYLGDLESVTGAMQTLLAREVKFKPPTIELVEMSKSSVSTIKFRVQT